MFLRILVHMPTPCRVVLQGQVVQVHLVDLDHLVGLDFQKVPLVRVVHRFRAGLLVHQLDLEALVAPEDQVDQVDL
jgi:hypothetical protein